MPSDLCFRNNCIEGEGRRGAKVSHNDRYTKQFRKDVHGVLLKKVLAIAELGDHHLPKFSHSHPGKKKFCISRNGILSV